MSVDRGRMSMGRGERKNIKGEERAGVSVDRGGKMRKERLSNIHNHIH